MSVLEYYVHILSNAPKITHDITLSCSYYSANEYIYSYLSLSSIICYHLLFLLIYLHTVIPLLLELDSLCDLPHLYVFVQNILAVASVLGPFQTTHGAYCAPFGDSCFLSVFVVLPMPWS